MRDSTWSQCRARRIGDMWSDLAEWQMRQAKTQGQESHSPAMWYNVMFCRHMERHTNISPAMWCHVLQRSMERHTNISPAVWCTMLCLQRPRNIQIWSQAVWYTLSRFGDAEKQKPLSLAALCALASFADSETELSPVIRLCDRGRPSRHVLRDTGTEPSLSGGPCHVLTVWKDSEPVFCRGDCIENIISSLLCALSRFAQTHWWRTFFQAVLCSLCHVLQRRIDGEHTFRLCSVLCVTFCKEAWIENILSGYVVYSLPCYAKTHW